MGCISAIVEYHVRLPILSSDTLVDAPPKVLFSFASPCEYRISSVSQRCGHFILGRVNIAGGPSHLSSELYESLDENGCLSVYMSATDDLGILQRL